MRLTQWVLFLCLLMFGSYAMSEQNQQVGQVLFSIGNNYMDSATGSVKLQAGTPILVGQTVHSDQTGHVHIRMQDGAFLSIRPDSEVKITLYHIDSANPQNNQIRLDVQKGGVRSVTGAAGEANKAGFRLNTPIAAIGIRGTDFTVFTDAVISSVSVRQGGVVVSPFNSVCSRSALGACGGSQTVMLSAYNQQMVAEVFQHQANLVSKEEAKIIPDTVKPAHPAEDQSLKDAKEMPVSSIPSSTDKVASTPSAANKTGTDASSTSTSGDTASVDKKTSASTATSTASTRSAGLESVSAAASKSSEGNSSVASGGVAGATQLVSAGNAAGSAAVVAPLTPVTETIGAKESVTSELASRIIAKEGEAVTTKALNNIVANSITPTSTPPASVAEPKVQPFSWGRWSSYVQTADQNILQDPVRSKQIVAFNGPYILANAEKNPVTQALPTPQWPTGGEVSFKLDKGEVGVLSPDKLTLRAASMNNPQLTVNFGTDRFTTSMDVNSTSLPDGYAHLSANGTLTDDSKLSSIASSSNMTVTGALNSDGTQAGYLFNQATTGIVGVATWQAQP